MIIVNDSMSVPKSTGFPYVYRNHGDKGYHVFLPFLSFSCPYTKGKRNNKDIEISIVYVYIIHSLHQYLTPNTTKG